MSSSASLDIPLQIADAREVGQLSTTPIIAKKPVKTVLPLENQEKNNLKSHAFVSKLRSFRS